MQFLPTIAMNWADGEKVTPHTPGHSFEADCHFPMIAADRTQINNTASGGSFGHTTIVLLLGLHDIPPTLCMPPRLII